jgi:hypothetical protein
MATKQTTTQDAPTTNGRATVTVTLQTPIVRAGETITTLRLMKPRTGDLRGLMLYDVMQLKADTVAALLPRISMPTIMKHEVDELDPADLVACGMEVVNFLVPKSAMESQDE